MIEISLNSTRTIIAADTPLIEAIIYWGIDNSKIAVAINGEFVPRSNYAQCVIKAGDEIDIVNPVGGG